MAQAGLHALVGQAVSKWRPDAEWLMPGLILGSIFPDFDNLAVAVATVAKLPTESLHRTFTHSIFTALAFYLLFWGIGKYKKDARWTNLGIGFGIGILMHIILDLIIWFNGVAILWPIPAWVNFWEGVSPPAWFATLLNPLEFLFLAVYFWMLGNLARKNQTDPDFLGKLTFWTVLLTVLFVIFTPLAYWMQKGYLTIFGLVYLIVLGVATWVIIRMRKTIETA